MVYWYKNKLPEEGDLVMVTVRKISDLGVYVTLDEYDSIEGMIPSNELSRRKYRVKVRQIVKEGTKTPLVVINVNPATGCVDMSKKRMTEEDNEECQVWYKKSKTVDGIVKRVSDVCELDPQDVYRDYIWGLYGSPDDSSSEASNDDEDLDSTHAYDILKKEDCVEGWPECVKQTFLQEISKKLNARVQHTLVKEMEIVCNDMNGIQHIKDAFAKADAKYPDVKSAIQKIPAYTATLITYDPQTGCNDLEDYANLVKTNILAHNGHFRVIKEPIVN
uniref:S1 motif domain-containing protein n=1 Tax=viral metagenome TaxID=1070528 RepID=A0A6C0CKJ1_9ZZZZ